MSAQPILSPPDLTDLPTGTVAFLYTDVEGSTRLLEQLRDQYALLLTEHHEIMRSAFARWHGVELVNEGDSFFVVFAGAVDAVNCAAQVQRMLQQHAWPQSRHVRVRMGVHTGQPQIGPTGYVGMDLHRTARIGAAAHGAQVLLSKATRELVLNNLPIGATLRDLGTHQLKDISQPEHIYQLDLPGLLCEFPPLRSLAAEEEPPAAGDPPYKGLLYYTEADADLFFGREKLTERLVEAVGEHRFLAIIGASGSGKSSLIRAGMLPALRRAAAPCWEVQLLTPGVRPLKVLAAALSSPDDAAQAAAIEQMTADRAGLAGLIRIRLAGAPAEVRLLLIVDQFEELFTQCRDERERRAFVDNLIEAVRTPGVPATVVISLRADFYESLAQYPPLHEMVAREQEYIGAMNAAELRQAITLPAERAGWQFTPGLVDLILHDLGAEGDRQPEPGALPLLSHALLETWRRRRRTVLSLRAYFESGGVRGAIARTAERVYGLELSPEEQAIARNVFLRLTELGEGGGQNTRRSASLQEILSLHGQGGPWQVRAVLDKLADARLVTVGQDAAEVAHEALIREWPTLRTWLNEDREALRLQRRLTEAAHAWEDAGREPSELYRGPRLHQALDWSAGHAGQLNQLEAAFLAAAEAQEQRELAEAERARRARERLRRAVIVGLAAGMLLALALAAFAAVQWRQAEAERRNAVSNQLTAQAITALDAERYDLALLLSLEAYRSAGTLEARGNLLSVLERTPYRAILPGPGSAIVALDLASDGRSLAICDQDARVRIWSLVADAVANTVELPASPSACQDLAFSPDGARLAVASNNGNIELWERASLTKQTLAGGHDGAATAVAFSPDGVTLASGGADRRVVIWQSGGVTPRYILTGHNGAVTSLAFNADGSLLASGSVDQDWNETDSTVLLWDTATGAAHGELRNSRPTNVTGLAFQPGRGLLAAGYDNGTVVLWDVLQGRADGEPLIASSARAATRLAPLAVRVDFAPDGALLATADSDGGVVLWETEGRRARGGPYHVHTGIVGGLVFSRDGRTLVTGGSDNRVVLWSIGSQLEQLLPRQGGSQAWSVAFSPGGKSLASGWSDGSVVVWGQETEWQVDRLLSRPAASGVTSLAYDPTAGGHRLASAASDGKVTVWDLSAGGGAPAEFQEGAGGVNTLAFAPSGGRLAVAGLDGKIYLHDPPTWSPAPPGPLPGHPDGVWSVAFSPDGRTLASAGWDGLIRLWDVQSGQAAGDPLSGHTGPVLSVAFGPAGRTAHLASAGQDRRVVLWNVASRQVEFAVEGHTDVAWSVAISPDGTLLASSGCAQPGLYRDCQRGEIRLWDLATGRALGPRLLSQSTDARGLAFSPDGELLAVATNDAAVGLWEVGFAVWRSRACRIAGRDLSAAEWQQYLNGETYRRTCPSAP